MTELEYRNLPIDSSSSLKEFSIDRRKYKKKYIDREKVEEEDTKASTMGKLVETKLFEEEEFDNRFYLSSVRNVPGGKMGDFCRHLYRLSIENSNEEGSLTVPFENIAREAYSLCDYDAKRSKFETVIKNFMGSDAEIYYNELVKVGRNNLTVVTLDEINNCDRIVEELNTATSTSTILRRTNSDRYEVFKQYKIEQFFIDGLPLKAMIDLVIIDHKERVVNIYDLKCTWSVEGFIKEYFLHRRAYIQAYVYEKAAHQIIKNRNLLNYRVEFLKFIVCDSIGYYKPLIYNTDSDIMDKAYEGFEHKGYYYPGVGKIIEDLKWAIKNDEWRISRENHLNSGNVKINL